MTDDRFWVGPPSSPDTYQLVSCLGGGAEGEVWTAVLPLSTEGRRNVAVKILPGNTAQDSEEEWVRHGHLLRSISHPGLVRVLEVFSGPPRHRQGSAVAGSMRYVVMDHIEGVTAREWLDDHPDASVSMRLRTLVTVAAALDEMHSGAQTAVPVAHGDVKPSNIVMRPDGSTVLVDLGLTRLADGGGRVGRSRPYAAPELFAPGGRTSPEADRFAFAATVVHTILGEPPPVGEYGGPDLAAVDQKLRSHPLSARRPGLVNQLMQALAAPPHLRPANLRVWLGSLTDTLSQVTETGGGLGMLPPTMAPAEQTATGVFMPPPAATPGPQRPPAARRNRRPLVIAGAAAAAVLLVVIAAVAFVLKDNGSQGDQRRTSGADTGSTQTAVPTQTTPTTAPPAPTAEPSSESPSTGTDGSASPSESASGPGEGSARGVALAGSDSSYAGFIADRSAMAITQGNVRINGKTYLAGFTTDWSCCSSSTFVHQSTVDIDLSRKYKTLSGVAGVEDHSNANVSLRVQIYADNVVIFDKTVSLGHPEQFQLSVANVLRLRIVIIGQLYQAKGAIGDPTVIQ